MYCSKMYSSNVSSLLPVANTTVASRISIRENAGSIWIGIVLVYEAGRYEFPFLFCDLQYVVITFRAFTSVPFILGVAMPYLN